MSISVKRLTLYVSGMIVLAFGLTLNTKVTLGVSPLLALPYAISEIYSLNFSNLVFILYCLFIVAQLIIHRFVLHTDEKSIYVTDVLQIAVSLLFTRFMNLVSSIIPVFANECSGFFAGIWFRLLMLMVAMILTGTGASLILNMKLVPNPGDGVVDAIAQAIKNPLGTAKNIVDITCVFLTAVFSFVSSGKIVGIGIGTLLAMLGVGRVINFINTHFDLAKYAGK